MQPPLAGQPTGTERHAACRRGVEGPADPTADRGSEQPTPGEVIEVRNKERLTEGESVDTADARDSRSNARNEAGLPPRSTRRRLSMTGTAETEISLEEDVFSLTFLAMVELTRKKKIWSKQGNS